MPKGAGGARMVDGVVLCSVCPGWRFGVCRHCETDPTRRRSEPGTLPEELSCDLRCERPSVRAGREPGADRAGVRRAACACGGLWRRVAAPAVQTLLPYYVATSYSSGWPMEDGGVATSVSHVSCVWLRTALCVPCRCTMAPCLCVPCVGGFGVLRARMCGAWRYISVMCVYVVWTQ